MKFTILVLFLLLTTVVSAQDVLDARKVKAEVTINNEIGIERQGGYSEVQFVKANLSWYPIEYERQQILEFRTSPISEKKDNMLLFEWISPPGNVVFEVKAKTLTNSDFTEVKVVTPFPIKFLDEELIEYTKPQEVIDINDDIRDVAANIASGKEDLFEVVYSLAEYTRNTVEYNLSSLTVSASQKASWVLENKQGVCDELTSLFIAFVRSLGIPAKFVSGVSYTNSAAFSEPWQAHGWSEVYFPDVGWVPFDVTYGEYGWLDASHIKLRESLDSGLSAASYSGRGKNFEFGSSNFDLDVTIIDEVGRHVPTVSIELYPLWDSVAFGSYNVLQVNLENLQEYYVTDSIHFSKVEGIDLFLPESTYFMLKPLERKSLRYLIKVTENLNDGYYYAFPIEIITDRGIKAGTSFRVEQERIFVSKPEAELLVETSGETKAFGRLDCEISEKYAYKGDELTISCEPSADGVVCFNEECKASNFNFDYVATAPGYYTLQADLLSHGTIIGSSFFSLEIIDETVIHVEDFGIAEEVEYGGNVPVKFKFSSEGVVDSMTLHIIHENFEVEQKLHDLGAGNHEFTFMIDTTTLKPGKNQLSFTLEFSDKKGKIYEQSESISFELVNAPWYQSMYSWLQKTVRKLF